MVELREPERMTEEELRDFVLDVVEGRVWTSSHANGEGVNSFLSLLMSRLDEVDVDKVGAVWEYMDKASTRSVNGIPMFMSHRLMHLEDWKLAAASVDKYRQARAKEGDHAAIEADSGT